MKKEATQETCHCKAYKFPHRFMSGDCTGWTAVEEVFDKGSECSGCRYQTIEGDGVNEPQGTYCTLLEHNKQYFPIHCQGLESIVKKGGKK